MFSSLVPTTATVSPVSTQYIRQHARIASHVDDNLIATYALAATEMIEMYLSRYLLTREAVWTISESDSRYRMHNLALMPWQWTTFVANPVLDLPRKVQSVSLVTVGVWGSDDITLTEGTDYQLDLTGSIGRLRWLTNSFLNPQRDHLQVTFTSGYGDGAIPVPIIHAILLLTTNLYENRGDEHPLVWSMAIEALLANYRYTYFS